MAYEEAIRNITLNADATLASYTGVPGYVGSADPNYGMQYRFVKVTGARQCGAAAVNTDLVVGVMQNKPQVTNMAATVAIRGVSKVMAGAAITAGSEVMTDASGRAIPYVAGAGVRSLGVALDAATAVNTVLPVLLRLGQ